MDFARKSIRNKYLVLLVLFTMLPSLVLGVISNRVFTNILGSELNKSIYQTMEKASVNIGSLLQRMSDLSDYIMRNSEINKVLESSETQKALDTIKTTQSTDRALREVSLFFNFPIHVYILDKHHNLYCNINTTPEEKRKITESLLKNPDFQLSKNLDSGIHWIGLEKNLLPGFDSNNIYYLTRNIISGGEYQGTIYIGTGDYILLRMLDNIKVSDLSKIFLYDRNSGSLIAFSGSFQNGRDKEIIEKILTNGAKPQNISISGVNYSNAYYSTNFNWDIVMITPMKSIRDKLKLTNWITISITLMSLLLIFIFMLLINKSFVHPVIYLSTLMRIARKGNLDIRSELKSTDEIGVLSDGFNKMVADFKITLEKIQAEEIKKKELEFKVLQSQIKPHFLYNTLNSIRWMAEMNNETKVGDSIVSLVRMLEYNTRNQEKLVFVSDEVKYIKEYLELQNLRYWNKFETELNIDDEILLCKLPRLTLQPVVENCLTHGLVGLKGKLLINLTGSRYGDKIKLTVSDNGVGMGAEELQELRMHLDSPEVNADQGIGVSNVHGRIRLEFGQDFGIKIDSIQGKGTDVTIILPFISDEGGIYENIDRG